MERRSYFIVYPEGDIQEIEHSLKINQLVDLNGQPVKLPLPTHKMIIYRVSKISTNASRHEEERYYWLELVSAEELLEFTGL